VFLGLTEVMVEKADRERRGVGMLNMYYPPAFDDWAHELQTIRPEAYRSFQATFSGRSERSFLKIRSTKPSFMQGIGPHTLEHAKKYLLDYDYPLDAPLVTGVDDTKLLPALRPYFDGPKQKWFLLGSTGEPIEVDNIGLLQKQIADASEQKASKLRLWTLSIPLPNVPPLILAAMPISTKLKATNLADLEESLLELLLSPETNLNIVSLGSDGTTVEREARHELVRRGFATVASFQLVHPSSEEGAPPLVFEILKIKGRYLVVIQDSKHLRKTLWNNLFSGARLLIFGCYVVFYEHIRMLATTTNSPLYL